MSMFNWIRDGVRRSVLLGVSDAVTQLGLPSDDEVNPHLAAVIGNAPATTVAALPAMTTGGSVGRKRLGKSFQEIRQETEPK